MTTPVPFAGHKLSRALWEALRAAGWTATASRFFGNVIYSHPLSGRDRPTPEYMRGSHAWPFDTYFTLRQLTFNFNSDRVTKIWTREIAAPWVRESGRPVSFKRAIEYVGEEWNG